MPNDTSTLKTGTMLPATRSTMHIIAVGASAGGLAPLESFFESIHEMHDTAFIVIQHLPGDHKSMMTDLLARKCSMPVVEVTNHLVVEPGRVFLMPPGKLMAIEKGKFKIKKKPKNGSHGYPIDYFLHSLAEEQKDKSIAVILSGTGSDGAQGIRSIKQYDGLVIVQHPDSSQFDGMPKSAIATGLTDLQLAPSEMKAPLLKFISGKNATNLDQEKKEHNVESIINILQMLKDTKGLDFTRYKREFVVRRIHRSMSLCQIENLSEYFTHLQNSDSARDALYQDLLVGVTQFFRDLEAFDGFQNFVLPKLMHNSEASILRIWVPGCSTGEEAYSIAIMIQEFMALNQRSLQVKIFATDVNEKAITFASSGWYPESIARDVPPEYLLKYFIKKNDGYEVNRKIREMIVFTRHNLIEDVPFNRLDLISCRNLLIYFQPQIQSQIFAAFNFALKQDCFLWLGLSETADSFKEVFQPILQKFRIYQSKFELKRGRKHRIPSIMVPQRPQQNRVPARTGQLTIRTRLLESANEVLTKELGVAGMLINHQMELLRYFGDASRYLSIPQEPGEWNLLKMVGPDVAAVLSAGVRRAIQDNEKIQFKQVRFNNPQATGTYSLTVIPHKHEGLDGTLFMILIHESEQPVVVTDGETIELDATLSNRIHDLEHELRMNRENLQSIIEELQTSNEELMTANEELQGTNEELQSVNEELYTINAEHQKTIEVISDLNNDLDNLLKHTHLGILFLDNQLNIRRLNAAIKEEINVTEGDIGRPISHFSSQLNYSSLGEDARKVLETGDSMEKEVTSKSGKWYSIRIMPYEIGEDKPSGVVCTLTDISNIKGTQHLQELAQRNLDLDKRIKDLEAQNQELQMVLKRQAKDFEAFVDLAPAAFLKFNQEGKVNSFQIGKLFPGGPELPVSPNTFSLASLMDETTRINLWRGLEEVENQVATEVIKLPLVKKTESEEIYQEICISPENTQGAVVGIFDKSDLYFAREALVQSELLHRVIARNIPDGGIWVFDHDLNCLFSEANFLWDISEGMKVASPIEAEKSILESACKAALKGKLKQVEFVRHQDTFVVSFIPVKSEAGVVFAGLIIGQKITDMKKTQRDLQARLRDMEQFAYSVSHDLKSPLRSIAGFAQLLQKRYGDNFDETAEEYLNFIINNTKSMTELIQGLLNYALLGSDKKPPKPVEIDVVVQEVIAKLDALIKEKNGKIVVEELPSVMGFPAHMTQLFQNLIENGLKFNESKSRKIHISGEIQGKWAKFSIKDNGIGIEEQYQEQIFGVFKHLNTRDKYEGSGLGLSQCKRIVERMNGKIWVESFLGEGSTFHFTLPLHQKN